VKPKPILPKLGAKMLNFTLVCLAVVYSLKVVLALIPSLEAAPKTPPKSSKSSRTVSSSAKRSSVKSKATSTRKKVASRSKKPRSRVVRGQRTIESARVVEIQTALAGAGYYKEEPNGQWDESTSKAMSSYQADNGFRTTGKPDALSLKKLGL